VFWEERVGSFSTFIFGLNDGKGVVELLLLFAVLATIMRAKPVLFRAAPEFTLAMPIICMSSPGSFA
jgi:hypothetical protein